MYGANPYLISVLNVNKVAKRLRLKVKNILKKKKNDKCVYVWLHKFSRTATAYISLS